MTTLVWFRDDLRLADHPALTAAADDPDGVICLYVYDDASDLVRPLGGAARWWLHHSLCSLARSLEARGIPLILRRGAAFEVITRVVAESNADTVVWNRRYGPENAIDTALKKTLRARGRRAESFPGGMLHEPWTVMTGGGTPFRVYSAFWRACLAQPNPRSPLPVPRRLSAAGAQPSTDALDDWQLLPTAPDWSSGLSGCWVPGEDAAGGILDDFLAARAHEYETGRDYPQSEATSGLSPYLRWGEISPHTVWERAQASGRPVHTFLGELGWREFAWYTLYHHPDLASRNLDRRYDGFAWADPDADLLGAWRRGATGFPLVDAGMRELWHTGTMHNRVRMVTASFLTKNLLIDWRIGEAWFWDTLVDADPASNPFNWQWVAGCGADAVPYFRIFNPDLQRKKFDPHGGYVARWAPDPLRTPPIVDLPQSRRRALAAFAAIR